MKLALAEIAIQRFKELLKGRRQFFVIGDGITQRKAVGKTAGWIEVHHGIAQGRAQMLEQLTELMTAAPAEGCGLKDENIGKVLKPAALQCAEFFVERFQKLERQGVQPLPQCPVGPFAGLILRERKRPGSER